MIDQCSAEWFFELQHHEDGELGQDLDSFARYVWYSKLRAEQKKAVTLFLGGVDVIMCYRLLLVVFDKIWSVEGSIVVSQCSC